MDDQILWPDFERNDGLIRAVVQDYQSKDVLMDAYMNEEAFRLTLQGKTTVFFSRSRKRLWHKGEESGRVQWVIEIRINCNRDSLLVLVDQEGGAACHDGYRSCFYRRLRGGPEVIGQPLFNPKDVYKK